MLLVAILLVLLGKEPPATVGPSPIRIAPAVAETSVQPADMKPADKTEAAVQKKDVGAAHIVSRRVSDPVDYYEDKEMRLRAALMKNQ